MTWLSGWSKRQAITLTGGADGSQVDFQLKLSISYNSNMLSDFSDIRFTDADGETLIDAWLEDKTDGTSADVMVEFPSTPVDGVEQTYYMYYDKSDAVNYWDIGETFIAGYNFSSFSGWSGDTAKCIANQTYQSKSRCLKCNDDSSETLNITDDVAFPSAFIIECNIAEDSDYYSKVTAGNSTNTIRTGWSFRPDNIAYYWDSDNHTNSDIDPTIDTWYKVKLVAKGDTGNVVDMYIDDVLKLSNNTLNSIPTFLNLTFVGGTGQGNAYYNDLRVRKYTANPPTYEFSSEENAPVGGLSMAVAIHHLRQMRRS